MKAGWSPLQKRYTLRLLEWHEFYLLCVVHTHSHKQHNCCCLFVAHMSTTSHTTFLHWLLPTMQLCASSIHSHTECNWLAIALSVLNGTLFIESSSTPIPRIHFPLCVPVTKYLNLPTVLQLRHIGCLLGDLRTLIFACLHSNQPMNCSFSA